jgi:outer membrane protein assembly factor BamA
MKFAIVKSRFRQAGQPGVITPFPPFVIDGNPGDLTFIDAHAFSPGELRTLIPLQEGEIFNISKIRAGIEALNERCAANGFLDFTAVPNTEINNKLQRISLTLRLDEEKHRIGVVRVIGLDLEA